MLRVLATEPLEPGCWTAFPCGLGKITLYALARAPRAEHPMRSKKMPPSEIATQDRQSASHH